jgi:hypothetical protein
MNPVKALLFVFLSFCCGCPWSKIADESAQWRRESDEWRAKMTKLVDELSTTLIATLPGGTDGMILNKLHDPATPAPERERYLQFALNRIGYDPTASYQVSVELHDVLGDWKPRFDFTPAKAARVEYVKAFVSDLIMGLKWTAPSEFTFSDRTADEVRTKVKQILDDAVAKVKLTNSSCQLVSLGMGGCACQPNNPMRSSPSLLTKSSLSFDGFSDSVATAILEAYRPNRVQRAQTAIRKEWTPTANEWIILVLIPEEDWGRLSTETFLIFAHKKNNFEPSARLIEERPNILRKADFQDPIDVNGEKIRWAAAGLKTNTSMLHPDVLESIRSIQQLLMELKKLDPKGSSMSHS